ncbi:MAG: serine protease [Dehalococcoidia bacterium]|nr:serine protease [Dehalococcoidia bacterium]
MQSLTLVEQLLFATIRIETETSVGTAVGTAFLVSHTWGEDKTGVFLVTNKHVVDGASTGHIFLTAADGEPPDVKAPRLGDRINVTLPNFAQMWHPHPRDDVDVTIAPFAPVLNHLGDLKQPPFFRTFSTDQFASPEALAQLDALEDVSFIGYPIGIYDAVNLIPVIRSGATATPPYLDYAGKPAFLIDAAVFPGSSGSPVVLLNRNGYATRDGAMIIGSRFLLMGLVASVFVQEDSGRIEIREIPTGQIPFAVTRQMIGLGVVFKASAILECIRGLLRSRGETES